MSAPAQLRLRSGSSCSSLSSFLSLSISFHDDAAGHPVVAMIGDQAGIFERSGLGELPDDLRGLLRREADAVRIVMLHMRMLLHHFGMLQILLGGREQEFVI